MKSGFGAFGRNVRSGRHRNSSGDLTWVGTEMGKIPSAFRAHPSFQHHWNEARGALLRFQSQLSGASQIQPFHSPDLQGAVITCSDAPHPHPQGFGVMGTPRSHPVPPSPPGQQGQSCFFLWGQGPPSAPPACLPPLGSFGMLSVGNPNPKWCRALGTGKLWLSWPTGRCFQVSQEVKSQCTGICCGTLVFGKHLFCSSPSPPTCREIL